MQFQTIRTYLQRAHWLSLDVVLGTVFGSLAVWRLPNSKGEINILSIIVLALSVFVIYTADRLLDIRKNPHLNTPRHAFHAQHWKLLWRIILGLLLIILVLCFWLPRPILYLGLATGFVCMAYLLLVNRLPKEHIIQFTKEYYVALIYSVGIWVPPMLMQGIFSWESCLLAFFYVLLVFQSLLLFSWLEAHEAEEAHSLAILWGEETSLKIIRGVSWLLIVASIVLLLFLETVYLFRFTYILLLMTLSQGFITYHPMFFLLNERYRWIGELVFWWPLILL